MRILEQVVYCPAQPLIQTARGGTEATSTAAAAVDSRAENGHRNFGIPAFGVTELGERKQVGGGVA